MKQIKFILLTSILSLMVFVCPLEAYMKTQVPKLQIHNTRIPLRCPNGCVRFNGEQMAFAYFDNFPGATSYSPLYTYNVTTKTGRNWNTHAPFNISLTKNNVVTTASLSAAPWQPPIGVHFPDMVLTSSNLPVVGAPPPTTDNNLPYMFFTVQELYLGMDASGDFDMNDKILHVFDMQTQVTTNLGLPLPDDGINPGVNPLSYGDAIFFIIDESEFGVGGQDLNNDGDINDVVLCRYNINQSTLESLEVAVIDFDKAEIDGNHFVFLVSESSQGADLNNDGDTSDKVLHVYDINTRVLTNTRYAGWLHYFDRNYKNVQGGLVTLSVFESDQGHTDYNGDGDTSDMVIGLYNLASGSFTTVGSAEYVISGRRRHGDWLAFNISEANHFGQDLNGDGDAIDSRIPALYRISTGQLIISGIASSGNLALNDHWLVFSAVENQHGNQDLNNDGDITNEGVVFVMNLQTGQVENTRLTSFGPFMPLGDNILFFVNEMLQGMTDLNNDGACTSAATCDAVLHSYDATRQTATSLNLALPSTYFFVSNQLPEVVNDTFGIAVSEQSSGNTDLNNDGDMMDMVLHTITYNPLKMRSR